VPCCTVVLNRYLKYRPDVMRKSWHMIHPDPQHVQRLADQTGCHPLVARILVNRNISETREAKKFLYPRVTDLPSPLGMKGMDVATQRLIRAIRQKENILVFGDYDVDGVTATALLEEFLSYAGARVFSYTPHRRKEGYSLNREQLRRMPFPRKPDLILTADCGATSHDAIRDAQKAGIDVIVTDHHMLEREVPPAIAIVNPHLEDAPSEMSGLSGVGVAFCLLISLRKTLREQGFWGHQPEPNLRDYCDLVALGTIADMVPLLGANRILARVGLDVLKSGRRPGLSALMSVSGVVPERIDAEDISFRLAPRLNAAGRMAHSRLSVRLIQETDPVKTRRLAELLERLNRKRRAAEQRTLDQVASMLTDTPELLRSNSLVLAHPEWLEGVLGIAASRLVNQYGRPAILITTRDGIGKGSARSVSGFDIHQGLHDCRPLLESFGGHRMAAGLQVKAENIEALQDLFEQVVARHTRSIHAEKRLPIDGDLALNQISPEMIDALELLKPFGAGNPEPVFSARRVAVQSFQVVGQRHLRMTVAHPSSMSHSIMSGIWFNPPALSISRERLFKIAFRLQWNRWNGKKTPQIVIEDMVPDTTGCADG